MKILFISHIKKDDSNGVWKKVKSQIECLKSMGNKVDYIYFSDNDNLVVSKHNGLISKIRVIHRYLFFFYLTKILNDNYDVVYIRKPHGGAFPLGLNIFVNKIKSKKIYMEIPTYPFKNESKTFFGKVSNFIFDIHIKACSKKIDRLIIIGDTVDELYGIKTKNINNGIDFNSIPNLQIVPLKKCEELRFLGVANLTYWHGYDRLILAMKNYSGPVKVIFDIVGDTEPELSRLKKITNENNIKNVNFLGRKDSSEINKLLESTNIGVDSLGRHRSGNNFNSSIKSKEYAAIGLPFIKSHIDSAFDQYNLDFLYKCSSDEEPIDIGNIIHWYESLSEATSLEEIAFAKQHLTWQSIFSRILSER